jgi:hypothetical protein
MNNAELKKMQTSLNNSKNNKFIDDISDSDEKEKKNYDGRARAGGGVGERAGGGAGAGGAGAGAGGGGDSDSDDGDGEGEKGYELHNEFKDKVVAYIKADDKIRELQNVLKDYRKIKKDSEEGILRHLERLGESMINVTGGKLRKNQYESKAALKKELIKEALSEKIKDVVIVEELLNKMEDKREVKINVSIKRTFEREKKGKA